MSNKQRDCCTVLVWHSVQSYVPSLGTGCLQHSSWWKVSTKFKFQCFAVLGQRHKSYVYRCMSVTRAVKHLIASTYEHKIFAYFALCAASQVNVSFLSSRTQPLHLAALRQAVARQIIAHCCSICKSCMTPPRCPPCDV